jgi:hypothetical protein
MVRRATLDRGGRPEEFAAGDQAPDSAPDRAPRRRGTLRSGSGGRWLVWVGRIVLWALVLVIGYRGIVAIFAPPAATAPAPVTSSTTDTDGFPVQLAEAFAMNFGQVYLNFSPGTAAQRASELAAYLPSGATDPQLGWNGAGSQRLQSEEVVSISVRNAHSAVVTLLAQVNGRLMDLGVPIYAASGGMSVPGEPALTQGPGGASPPSPSNGPTDPGTQAQLLNQLKAFFQAYGAGDQVTLGRFLAPGITMSGLDNTVTFGGITGINVPVGGTTRQVTVAVKWQTIPSPSGKSPVSSAPAGIEMTYQLTVVRQGGTWYVKAIGPSTEQLGPP